MIDPNCHKYTRDLLFYALEGPIDYSEGVNS